MTEEPRYRGRGQTMSEWVSFMPNELNDIGVGLYSIIGTGRRAFGLEGAALTDFIRRSLYALVERGARPRHAGSFDEPRRDTPLHYGNDTNAEIVEGVIADWLAAGAPDLEWGDFWFELPGRPKGI